MYKLNKVRKFITLSITKLRIYEYEESAFINLLEVIWQETKLFMKTLTKTQTIYNSESRM